MTKEEKLLWKKLKLVFERLNLWAQDQTPMPNDKRHGTVRQGFKNFLQRETKKLAEDLDKVVWLDLDD